MGSPYASGRFAFGFCDRCSFRYPLKDLGYEVVKQRRTGLLICPDCFNPDQPQLMLGTFPVFDPQALRNPRVDTTYKISGQTVNDTLAQGSRIIEWGWNPVGGANSSVSNTPNSLIGNGQVGTVTVVIS
jgi:hypothetical protein